MTTPAQPDTPTPAEQLRAAATRLRERAAAIAAPEPVNSEPWHTEECAEAGYGNCPCIVAQGRIHRGTDHEVPARYIADAETPEIAAWIALMHPGVGEPLARLLIAASNDFAMVERVNSRDPHNDGKTRIMPSHLAEWALAVARALLDGAP